MSDKKAAQEAFADKFNATPADCSEADRFRDADDRLKGSSAVSLQALAFFDAETVPDAVKATMEAWCLLHGKEMSFEQCLKMVREEPADFKLVGMSDLSYMKPEEIDDLEKHVAGLELECADEATEVAKMMLEWLQAALGLHRWAQQKRELKNGIEAAMKYYQDEELMLKISQKMGGLPSELSPVLQKIEDTAMTLHEAAKRGDVGAVKSFLDKKKPLDSQDHKGITALGYAIGANRIAVVKLLLDSRANPYAVDSSGNSGLHYAAGYGRKELLEYLLKVGANVNQPNAEGVTPLAAATQNRQEATIQVLKAHGAQ